MTAEMCKLLTARGPGMSWVHGMPCNLRDAVSMLGACEAGSDMVNLRREAVRMLMAATLLPRPKLPHRKSHRRRQGQAQARGKRRCSQGCCGQAWLPSSRRRQG